MAVLAFALSDGVIVATPVVSTAPVAARKPRPVCTWILDPVSGRYVCRWDTDAEPRHPHLKLVRQLP